MNKETILEKYDTWLLDMDGVLIDSLAVDLQIVPTLMSKFVGKKVTELAIKRYFALSVPDFWRALLAEIGVLDFDQLDELLNEYKTRRAAVPLTLCSGAKECLKRLRVLGKTVAVVSNNPDQEVEATLEQAGLRELVNRTFGNSTIVRRKPAPDAYLLAFRELGVEGGACVAVEDSVVGVTSANAAGTGCVIGVMTGGDCKEDLLQAGADQVVFNLMELI